MHKKSLLEASTHLHAHSLESFIADSTADQDNHNFQELLSHPHLNTIKKQYQALIELYSHHNYQHYAQNKHAFIALKPSQIKTLKIISLLSIFEGQNSVKTESLKKALQFNEEELIAFLVQLSIAGTISIRIDEEGERVMVLNSQPRNGRLSERDTVLMRIRMGRVINKNKAISQRLNNMKEELQ